MPALSLSLPACLSDCFFVLYTRTHAHTRTYIHTDIIHMYTLTHSLTHCHTYTSTCICSELFTHTYTYIDECLCLSLLCVCVCTYYMHSHTETQHTHTHTHTYTHTHTHTGRHKYINVCTASLLFLIHLSALSLSVFLPLSSHLSSPLPIQEFRMMHVVQSSQHRVSSIDIETSLPHCVLVLSSSSFPLNDGRQFEHERERERQK